MLHILPAVGVVSILNVGHSNWYVMISHCLTWKFFNDVQCWTSFLCLCAINIWMYALVRCLFGSFAHFLIRLFILLLFSSLYILDNGLLSNASFINISPSLCITFSSSWHCLLQGRSSNLMKSILPIISLMNCAFGVVPKSHCQT